MWQTYVTYAWVAIYIYCVARVEHTTIHFLPNPRSGWVSCERHLSKFMMGMEAMSLTRGGRLHANPMSTRLGIRAPPCQGECDCVIFTDPLRSLRACAQASVISRWMPDSVHWHLFARTITSRFAILVGAISIQVYTQMLTIYV